MNINDKKSRFLKKVQDEFQNNNEIIFMISIDNHIEKENDEIRGHGSYRKAVHAIQSLVKYEFNPILSIVNYKGLPSAEIKANFRQMCLNFGFETSDLNFKIIPLINKNHYDELSNNIDYNKLNVQCSKSRTLTKNGVFNCPLLSSDNRGKSGTDFNDYSHKSYLETPFCMQ